MNTHLERKGHAKVKTRVNFLTGGVSFKTIVESILFLHLLELPTKPRKLYNTHPVNICEINPLSFIGLSRQM